MGPARKGRPHSSTSRHLLSVSRAPRRPIATKAAARPHTEPVDGDGVSIPQRSPTHSRLLAPSRRRLCSGHRMACRCAACKAWLRCPWAVTGHPSDNATPLTVCSCPLAASALFRAPHGLPMRGLRGLAAVPMGGGGVSIPQRSPTHSRLLAPSRRRLCSGRRMACPPARRPRRELRSARRLEARPGPAGPAAPSTRPTPAQYGVVVLPYLPCSASVYITRPRPVSRPRPRR